MLNRTDIFLFSGGVLRRLAGAGDLTAEGDTLASATNAWFNGPGQLTFVDPDAAVGRVYRLPDEGTASRVAGEGDVVPVTPRFVSASTTPVKKNGQPVFSATIFPGERGIFDLAGTLLARVGDAAPGGGVITGITEVTSSDTGAVAFTAPLSTGGPGLFLASQGTLFEIARDAGPAPDGGSFFTLSNPSVNASGHVTFTSILTRLGIFLAADGTITTVARSGDPAPGGGTFMSVTNSSLNDAGQIAIGGFASPPGFGIFLASGGELTQVVGAGDPAPGGGTFGSFIELQLNAPGQIAFQATVVGGTGVFLFGPNEGILSVARPGDAAPGGDTFDAVETPSLNSSGHVAFLGRFFGAAPSPNGAFLFSNGNLESIARAGDVAPGGDPFTSVADPKIGADGQILLTGTTASTGMGVFLARRSTPQLNVRIDIRPRSLANRIDPASTDLVPVAILSDQGFDAQPVIVDTARFGPTGTEAPPVRSVARDVDGDGDIDLVLRFRISETGIQCGHTSARLTAQTSAHGPIGASDAIQTVRCQ